MLRLMQESDDDAVAGLFGAGDVCGRMQGGQGRRPLRRRAGCPGIRKDGGGPATLVEGGWGPPVGPGLLGVSAWAAYSC